MDLGFRIGSITFFWDLVICVFCYSDTVRSTIKRNLASRSTEKTQRKNINMLMAVYGVSTVRAS